MTYKGHVKDGVIVIDESAPLPDGTTVRIEVLNLAEESSMHEDISKVKGIIPKDLNAREAYLDHQQKKHQ